MKPRARVPLTIVASLVLLLALLALAPGLARADAGQAAGPIEDILKAINCFVVKAIQDLGRFLGILLWDVLKLGGMVGLLGDDFDTLFQGIIADALGAITTGSLHTIIRGSLMVSLGILGCCLLARAFWPDLKIVSFQRVVIWGLVIQAFLLNATGIYTQLEAFRTDLAEEIASAVASGSVPGCGGDTVPTLLCIAGATESDVQAANLAELPDSLPPYGGSETIHDLYDHCVYNPAVSYGDAACNSDDPTGDPWEVLPYVQDALGSQVLDIVIALLILCYGILHIALGLSAGLMFVLFPVAAIFAFYQPLEGFPAGVIKNYVTIVLKSVVLLTLAGIVIRLFSVATTTLISMAAVALVALFLCFVMAKEALATLLGSVSFIGNSVGNIGANLGLTGAGGGANLMQASPESRMAAMMIGGGPVAQALMGAPNPYLHGLGGAGGGGIIGGAGNTARAALGAAFGGAGLALGAIGGAFAGRAAAAGSAAVTTSTLSTSGTGTPDGGLGGGASPAGSGATTPAGGSGATTPAGSPGPSSWTSLQARPAPRPAATPPDGPVLAPADGLTGEPPAIPALQAAAAGDTAALDAWSPDSAQRLQDTAGRLDAAPPEVQDNARELIRAGYNTAESWQADGRSPVLPDGTLAPAFLDETIQAAPEAAGALALAQVGRPAADQVRIGEVVALGAATRRAIPAAAVTHGFARAVKGIGAGGDLDSGLRAELGAGTQAVFGGQAAQAERVAGQMRQAGLANDHGRQLIETVQDDLQHNPELTAQQFREGGGPGRQARMQAWDQATGDPETTDRIVDSLAALGASAPVTLHEVPRPPAESAPAAAPAFAGPPATAPEPDEPLPPMAPGPAVPPAAVEPVTDVGAPAGPAAAEPAPAAAPAPDDSLAGQLRAWRYQTAQDAGHKAFYVFSDTTLAEIAARRPQTLDELAAIKGIGPKKLERYGAAILAMTQAGRPPEEKQA